MNGTPARAIYQRKYNGTEKAHSYLRKHYLKKRNRSVETIPIVETMMQHKNEFHALISSSSYVFDGKKLVIWDTECDAVGGGHNLADVREWCFIDFQTKVKISLKISFSLPLHVIRKPVYLNAELEIILVVIHQTRNTRMKL